MIKFYFTPVKVPWFQTKLEMKETNSLFFQRKCPSLVYNVKIYLVSKPSLSS